MTRRDGIWRDEARRDQTKGGLGEVDGGWVPASVLISADISFTSPDVRLYGQKPGEEARAGGRPAAGAGHGSGSGEGGGALRLLSLSSSTRDQWPISQNRRSFESGTPMESPMSTAHRPPPRADPLRAWIRYVTWRKKNLVRRCQLREGSRPAVRRGPHPTVVYQQLSHEEGPPHAPRHPIGPAVSRP